MRLKKWILFFITLIVVVYVSFGVWIAKDTKVILEKAMSGAKSNYEEHMDESVYKGINLHERGMTTEYTYNKASHDVGLVFPLHLFFVTKAFVSNNYSEDEFGFRESVNLSLKLKDGKWYATKVQTIGYY
ncbi:hypothetical protein M4D81_29700 [Paenibacillus sp. p3-SID867]|uniref:hypothetical protein n=1 Tax=Paenibacillus sp. p3-SID867 TaxID=2916363 RepID=UPI0021A5AD56|nr:hypothetical protein [Paenibacillus sp. p3-SID867]MCT1403174.1 hypothetical protein [Paenibacillus sp. p3-SID867]